MTERRALTILFADVSGSTKLFEARGDEAAMRIVGGVLVALAEVAARHGGRVVKTEADNVFATFDDVPPALATARAIQRSLDAANTYLPEDWDLHAGIGIGYGPILLIGDQDLFGSEMNVASKLGEDVAARGEILLSSAARERIESEIDATEIAVQLSGITLRAYRCA